MKHIAALILVLLIAASAHADVPPMISYQGKLMQPSGATVPDGTYSLQFAIYDVPTGGTALWSETNPGVQVKGGLFSVLLGSVNNLPANVFDSPDRFFGVKVGADPEMIPRQKIASVGYAVKAGAADLATTVPDSAITTSKIALGAVTADRLAPGVATPVGTIVMWSGAVANVPQGWRLCDGTNGTPDLRNRFIVGAGDEYAVATTGGEKFHQLTAAEMPVHSHGPGSLDVRKDSDGGQFLRGRQCAYYSGGISTAIFSYAAEDGDAVIVGQTGGAGGDQPHENRPPYYALCFIMKVGS